MDNILYNLLYSLNAKLDKNDIGSIDFILSKYFIQNLYLIPESNIYQIAEDCNVSRASIRRFSKSLGFENFAHMKRLIRNHSPQNEIISDKNYRELLTGNLIRIANELDERMDTHEIDVICNRIKNSDDLFIFASKTSMSNARDFQIELASKGKLAYIIDDVVGSNPMLNKIKKDDYVITLSITGLFAKSIKDSLKPFECTNDLITVNRIEDFSDFYTNVYYMSHLDHSKNPDIYRAYGLHYFLDIIQNHFYSK